MQLCGIMLKRMELKLKDYLSQNLTFMKGKRKKRKNTNGKERTVVVGLSLEVWIPLWQHIF